MTITTYKTHYHLLNILKLISIIAITVFHVNEFIFFEDFFPLAERTFIYPYVLKFSHLFPYSGHSLVSIVFFLWGIKQTPFSKLKKVLPILIIGQVLITMSFLEGRSFSEAWEWDIYCFLFVAILSVKFIQHFSHKKLLGIILLSISLFFFSPMIEPSGFGNNLLSEVLLGRCFFGKTGAWPLFPWIGLPLFSYSMGRLLKNKGSQIKKRELIFWLFVLIWNPLTWGKLYDAPIGPHFYCYMFNQPISLFWGNFLIIFFLIRLSIVDAVQLRLNNFKLIRLLSQLHWSRHLGICYLLQILILCLLSDSGPFFQQNPIIFDLMFVLLIPTIEVLVKMLFVIQMKAFQRQKN